jgi:hypothetical protein
MYNRNQYLFEAAVVDRGNMEFVTDKLGNKMPLKDAANKKRTDLERAGVYHITWQQDKKEYSYIGRAGGGKQTVRQRLQDHILCITRFGGDLSKYQVQVELMKPGADRKFPARINQQFQKDLKTREKERIDASRNKDKAKFQSQNIRELEFLFEAVDNSCNSTGLSDSDCGAILALPLSGCCRSGFRNTCYSHTFIPAKKSPLNIRVNVDYLSPPASWVSAKEDFSVQVLKCGSVFGSAWTTDIGKKRISSLGLPNSLSFSIAAVTPGEKYFIKIYSRSGQELIADYRISQ